METTMSASKQNFSRKAVRRARERGSSLIETMIASLVLLVGIVPLAGVFGVAVATNAGQGDIANRTALNAQDKMEQLLALSFNEAASNTTVYPTATAGGTGLGGVMAGNTTVGSVNPAAPVAGYVDYLTFQGVLQTTLPGARYRRQWSISTDATGNLKTITVLVTAVSSPSPGVAPSTKLVCMKVQ
jgi:Tfp pilus assembly protein PilV